MQASRSSNQLHWETYYRGGALTSCPVGADAEYTQELRAVWVEYFSALPDGARIVDVGTGNGAIALFASQAAAAAGLRFEIHGTDLARVDPVRDVPDGARLFAGIHFHPEVATERLPFESGSVDAVSGQYALEYSAARQSLPEIQRVLRAGGSALFVLHHADSVVARNARESLSHSALVLEDTKVLRRLRRYLDAESRSPATAKRASADLAAAIEALTRAGREAGGSVTLAVTLDAVRKLIAGRQQLSPAALARTIDQFESDLRAGVRRLEDLVRFARTEADMRQLSELAGATGLAVTELALQYHGGVNLVGWRLRLARPA